MTDLASLLQPDPGQHAHLLHVVRAAGFDEWITGHASGISVEQARMLALVETAEKAFTPTSMSPQEAETLANALDRALDDDE